MICTSYISMLTTSHFSCWFFSYRNTFCSTFSRLPTAAFSWMGVASYIRHGSRICHIYITIKNISILCIIHYFKYYLIVFFFFLGNSFEEGNFDVYSFTLNSGSFLLRIIIHSSSSSDEYTSLIFIGVGCIGAICNVGCIGAICNVGAIGKDGLNVGLFIFVLSCFFIISCFADIFQNHGLSYVIIISFPHNKSVLTLSVFSFIFQHSSSMPQQLSML